MNLFNIYLEEIKKTVLKKYLFKILKSDLVNVTLEKPLKIITMTFQQILHDTFQKIKIKST